MRGEKKLNGKKIFYVIASALGVAFAWLLGKLLSNHGDGIESNPAGDKPATSDSERAERISKNAGESAQRIFDIIERVKSRKSETEEGLGQMEKDHS